MSDNADVTPVYQHVRGLLVAHLFDLNKQVFADTGVMLADAALIDEQRAFVHDMQTARRDAIADLCVYLSAEEFPAKVLPSLAARHWLLGCMTTFEGRDEQQMSWHGYKFVERAVFEFEEQFEARVFNTEQ